MKTDRAEVGILLPCHAITPTGASAGPDGNVCEAMQRGKIEECRTVDGAGFCRPTVGMFNMAQAM